MNVMGYAIERCTPFIASRVVNGEVGFVNPDDGRLYIIGKVARQRLASKMKRVPACEDIKGLIKKTSTREGKDVDNIQEHNK